ncbi:MAG: DNA polymerase III, subunit gamma and tau [Bdellovibrionales bacterium RIFCSPHIGHO2_01_FULL_40_29]|nr:MAG: DNA polymerase III, subunit gamma and tau [Bdellovibrionales bacterium RIFCSPHIGHO2_01_FULL_40_29]OFZ34903.1 MAG: DNA polymerase III, subunit gamma and tau [Bdellovibrionales bacterium RIFCSPHIGHO2_02_FULL_40_15]
MSYQVIARKYRPQSFDQMIGQSHITQTLTNALKNNRLPHALLFTGPRGTGKTSSARILAKAIRCPNAVDFVPCHTCQSCLEIAASRSIDVIEIDGASNNGVDAIRDLRDNVMFAPAVGKYKVFIIDEVHMLSTNAFNALLKTLEEPPPHVVFILATTEVHKIPQTILSRCQRFDFRRIALKQIADHLNKICGEENYTADAAALWLIARQGDGSMRDSLSLLDQVISFTNGKLTEAEVSQVLGLTERSLVYEIFQNILNRNPIEMVGAIKKLAQSGQNPNLFLEDLSKIIRHSLILKTDATARLLIDLPDDEIDLLLKQVESTSDGDLHLLFDMTLKSLSDISRAQDPQTLFEMALLRLAQAPRILDLQQLLSGKGDSKVRGEVLPTPPKPAEAKAQPQQSKVTLAPKESVKPTPVAAPKILPLLNADNWILFVEKLKSTDALTASKIENLYFVDCQNKKVSLQPPMQFAFIGTQLQTPELREKLQGLIDSEFGPGYTFEVLKAQTDAQGDSAQSLSAKKLVLAEEKKKESWQLDPRIQKAQEVFKGQIKIIKND